MASDSAARQGQSAQPPTPGPRAGFISNLISTGRGDPASAPAQDPPQVSWLPLLCLDASSRVALQSPSGDQGRVSRKQAASRLHTPTQQILGLQNYLNCLRMQLPQMPQPKPGAPSAPAPAPVAEATTSLNAR